MKKKLLSVCVLCYNHGKFLEKNIQSIIESGIKDLEIIVVDDGSKDDSVAIINKLKDKNNCPFIAITQENTGNIGHNFNVALKNASGEFVTFISADDFYNSKELLNNYNILNNNDNYAFVASTKIKEVNSKNQEVTKKKQVPPLEVDKLQNPTINDLLELEYNTLGVFYIQGCLFRKKIIDEINGFDEDLVGDDIILRTKVFRYLLNHQEYSFFMNHNACCFYRRHDNNVSKNGFRQMLIVSQYLERYWPERPNPPVFYSWLYNSFQFMESNQIFELFAQNKLLTECLKERDVQNFLIKTIFKKVFEEKAKRYKITWAIYNFFQKVLRRIKKIKNKIFKNEIKKIEIKENKVKNKILKKYKKEYPVTGNKTAIVMCDDTPIAKGGLCDRLRGIVSIYQSCKKENIDFRLNFVSPFDLSQFMCPNTYDWSINSSEILYKKTSLPVFLFSKMGNESEAKDQELQVLNELKKEYTQFHFWTNAHYSLNSESFGKDFNELFRPSDELQCEINKYLVQINSDYISVSFRFIQLLNDFNEHYNVYPVLSVIERKQLIEKCLCLLNEIYKKEGKKIFVATDSITFLNAAKELPFVFTIPGDIAHVDATNDNSFEKNKKTFIDFYMISNASKVFLAHSGKMFYSGFPRTAALAGSKEFEIIEF